MAGKGGQTTQAGIDYQNKIATLFLGRMIDPGPWPENDVISAVRNEDPTAEVDDVVLYYQDKHKMWIQVKLDMEDSGDTWIKFWKHMINQWWNRPIDSSEDDRLVLAISQTWDWVKALEQICSKAFGSSQSLELASRNQQVDEWYGELSKDQEDLIHNIVADVSNQPRPKKRPKNKTDEASTAEEPKIPKTGGPVPSQYVQNDALFELFSHMEVWTQYHPDKIEDDHGRSFMPKANQEWFNLFDILYKYVGNNARYGKSISRKEMIDHLKDKTIFITGSFLQAAPFQAPDIGSHYVPRSQETQKVVSLLIEGNVDATPHKVAISGFPGSGKSALAAAVAHEEAIKQCFPGGVLWVTLGQEPNPVGILSGWVQELGDYQFKSGDPQVLQAHLNSLMQDKAVLTIVDDAWKVEDATSVVVGGPRCALLLTSRDITIAKAVEVSADRLYEIPVMEEEQALQILAGGPDSILEEQDRGDMLAVTSALGNLPLALKLAYAQTHGEDSLSWKELRTDLEQEISRLENLDDASLRDLSKEDHRKRFSLISSIMLSLRRLGPSERLEFAWLGVLPDDADITRGMAATLWGVDERQARKDLIYLRDKSLLSVHGEGRDGQVTYHMHDTLHDMAKQLLISSPEPVDEYSVPGLGLSLAETHAKFLERYRRLLKDGKWHTLPDDGYIFKHLAWHMVKAGQVDALHSLLREETQDGRNGWFSACSRTRQTSIFLENLRLAWEFAIKNRNLPLQLHYAICFSSVVNLHINTPGILLARMVELGWVSPEEALSIVLSRDKNYDVGALNESLLDLLPAFSQLSPDLVPHICRVIESTPVYFKSLRTESFLRAIPYLSMVDKKRFALMAINILREDSSRFHLSSVRRLLIKTEPGKYLDVDMRENFIRLLDSIDLGFAPEKIELLSAKLHCISKEEDQVSIINECLELLYAHRDENETRIDLWLMDSLFPWVSAELRIKFIREIFEHLDSFDTQDYWDPFHLLRNIQYFTDAEINTLVKKYLNIAVTPEHILRILRDISDTQVQILIRVEKKWLLDKISEIPSACIQSEAIALISPYLSEEESIPLLKKAEKFVNWIGGIDTVSLMVAYTPYMPPSFQYTLPIKHQFPTFKLWTTLVRNWPYLTNDLIENVRNGINGRLDYEFPGQTTRGQLSIVERTIIQHTDFDFGLEFLQDYWNWEVPSRVALLATELLSKLCEPTFFLHNNLIALDNDLWGETQNIVENFNHEIRNWRDHAGELVHKITQDRKGKKIALYLFQLALSASQSGGRDSDALLNLFRLSFVLPPKSRDLVTRLLENYTIGTDSREYFSEIRYGLLMIVKEPNKAIEGVQKVLKVCKDMFGEPRLLIFIALSSYLNLEIIPQVVLLAREIPNKIIPGDDFIRAEFLFGLSKLMCNYPPDEIWRIWDEPVEGANLLQYLASRQRDSLTSDLSAMMPLLHHLGGDDILSQMLDSVGTINRWWP